MATATSPLVGSIDGRTCGEAQRVAQTKPGKPGLLFVVCWKLVVIQCFTYFAGFKAHNTLGIQGLTPPKCHPRKSRVLVEELLASIMTSCFLVWFLVPSTCRIIYSRRDAMIGMTSQWFSKGTPPKCFPVFSPENDDFRGEPAI